MFTAGRRAADDAVVGTETKGGPASAGKHGPGDRVASVEPNGSGSTTPRAHAKAPARLVELDGLRGLAALSVVCYHWLLTDPAVAVGPATGSLTSGMNWLNGTPLRALVAGPEMVLLFFVLSGMVLSLPRLAGRGVSYGRFLFARAMRLYPAAWAVTAIALLGLLVEPTHTETASSTIWLAREFAAPIRSLDAFHYVALIFPFDPTRLDGPLWSLELELRACVLLPLLVWLVCRCGSRIAFVAAVALIVHGTTASLVQTSWIWTEVVIGCFLLGILLARHRDSLNHAWAGASTSVRRLAGLAILMSFWLPTRGIDGRVGSLPIGYLVTILGACALIVAAQGPRTGGWLSGRVPAWLGRISYSLYLVHTVVLKLLVTAAPAGTPPIALAPAGIAISLALATLLQRAVEAPAIRLAKTAWTTRRPQFAIWRRFSLRA